MLLLKDFDNQLINGLDFCKMAYTLFESIRKSPNGIEMLRLRKGKLEKKLLEELLPIAQYVQSKYNHGRQIKVRWKDGSQNYDAHIFSSGAVVEKHFMPKSNAIEVTTAVHENDHIFRNLINKRGYAFSVKGIRKVPKTQKYSSTPHVYTNDEAIKDLALKIFSSIMAKNEKSYPRKTTLIIQCFLDTLFTEDEWDATILTVKNDLTKHKFYEIFIFDSNNHYSATLYGKIMESSRNKIKCQSCNQILTPPEWFEQRNQDVKEKEKNPNIVLCPKCGRKVDIK